MTTAPNQTRFDPRICARKMDIYIYISDIGDIVAEGDAIGSLGLHRAN